MENYYKVVSKKKETVKQNKSSRSWFSTRCLQRNKNSIWPLAFLGFLCAIGLILMVVVVIIFKQYYILLSFLPTFCMTSTIIIFGLPFPFVLSELDLFYIIYQDDEIWRNVGHFLLSMWFTGIFGLLFILYFVSKITTIGLTLSLVAHGILSTTGLLFLIRYHYIRQKDDDESSSDEEETK